MRREFFIYLNKRVFLYFLYIAAIILSIFASYPAVSAEPEIMDKTISDAVEDELAIDSEVRSEQIDVFTIDGIVTLKGIVNNILAKERSARVARIVKGVRAVVNEIKVVPPGLYDDQQIKEQVEDAILLDPATESYEVDVEVVDNIVILTGTVQSWKERELCEKVAKGVRGVVGLENRINVSWDGIRTDLEIKTEIEEILKWDVFVDNGLIEVDVDQGEVTLTGIVGSAAEKYAATADSYVNGVKNVINSNLEVSRWARDKDLKGSKYSDISADQIEDAVKDALLFDPRVRFFKILVEITPDSKTVTLRGTVDNLKAKRAAAQDAKNTVGVRAVDNRIKVRYEIKTSDEKIKKNIKAAFRRDPYLEGYEIDVKVENGIVDLNGLVDTSFEKAQADDVASRVRGVISVDNNLIVKNFSNVNTFDPWVHDYYLYDFYWYGNMRRHPAKSDSEIVKDIKKELFWSPFVDGDNVEVKVDDGIATLTGKVDSWLEYNTALENAYKGGAVYVYNKLTVR